MLFFWFSSISTPRGFFFFPRVIIYNKLMHNLEYKSELWDDVMWSLDNISHILSIWLAFILDINPTEPSGELLTINLLNILQLG